MRYHVAAMHEATAVMPTAMITGLDVGRDSGRERARVTTGVAPMSPMKAMAKTRSGGRPRRP
jgi:hypothetical protein